MRHSPFLLIFSILISLCGSSCREDIAWSGVRKIDSDGWKSGDYVDFNLDPSAYDYPYADKYEEMTAKAIGDTAVRLQGNFRAVVGLRYNIDCGAAEVKIVMERSSLRSETSTDTLTFPLFSPNGEPLGKGRYGVYETSVEVPHPLLVDEGSVVSFTPVAYSSEIKGCMALSLILKK
ncbi:MAG: gliding motility lipoprotein GldH [Muribaculaceae bacterium]|nr:gliding motility lipoprotein GldH [Muribaculaceae bacterium]